MEGKASLEQCCLSMEMFTFTTKKFVRENPWTTLGISAVVAVTAAKAGRLSRLTSSISSSSMGLLVSSVSDITDSLTKPVAAASLDESDAEQNGNAATQVSNAATTEGEPL
ncbi:hypothetical protein QNE77_000102 [Vibrio alginolyticus]|uniref:hypothetical protein n=1 Tax=Vibrio alginolyticus TaxID=663 RepID=UPI002807AA59|nr:hypothetical protein [Vibrio alginolyticus]EGR2351693.1 hypothetical protein [Vibrio alginolyticus]EIL8372421.1 hypothetical protein [Vibrio alginolyticus]ELA8259914.1 hypothetical protein [Vibrio alginolyticus]ELB2925527.1 hypothetical protein [Vibrio alginolyticus]